MWSFWRATEINFLVTFVLQCAASVIESNVQLAPPTKSVIMAVLTPKSVIQLTAFAAFETAEFCTLYSFVGTIANIYLAEKKSGIANWLIEGK